jgi:hypothetical protein
MARHCSNKKITEHCSKNDYVYSSKMTKRNILRMCDKMAEFIIVKWLSNYGKWLSHMGVWCAGLMNSIGAHRLDLGMQSQLPQSGARGVGSRLWVDSYFWLVDWSR